MAKTRKNSKEPLSKSRLSFNKQLFDKIEEASSTQKLALNEISVIKELDNTIVQQIIDLSKAVYKQSETISSLHHSISKDLKTINRRVSRQPASPDFQKLFKELVRILNEMDEFVEMDSSSKVPKAALSWSQAIKAYRNRLEKVLTSWGCYPVDIKVGEDLFNPEIHRAVEPESPVKGEGLPEGTILKILRRGWTLQNQIIQYPEVIVNP